MAELIINRRLEGLFEHTLDGVQSAIDNRPNLTTFDILETGIISFHFKTKNGAPLVKNQEIHPEDITITDTFGGTPTQTGFTNAVQVWNALGGLGYFEGYSGSGAGAGGIEYFKQLLDVFPNTFQGQNNMVYVVNEAMNRLEPVFLYNYNRLIQMQDVESITADNIPNGYVLTSVTYIDSNGVAQKIFGFRPQSIMSQTPNGFITLGSFSLVDGLFTADTAWLWSQDGVEYGNLQEYEYTIEDMPDGSSRFYVFHTQPNSNSFDVRIGEISTDGNAVKPIIPLGAIELTTIFVNGSDIEDDGNPILGSPYVTKTSQSFIDYTANNADNGIPFDSLNGRSKFALTSATPYVVPAYVLDNSNLSTVSLATDMPVVFYNLGAGHIYKYNDTSIPFGMPFIFPDGQDFTSIQGSVISFLPRNGQLIFDNYSISSSGYVPTEYERTHQFSNFNIQGLDGAIVSIGDSNLEGFYSVLAGENNWFSKLIKEIQSYRGGNSEKGFINFANPSLYGYTLSGTYTNVTAGASIYALKMQPNSEIAFTSSSKFVEIWFDKISTGGSLEFYYNDVLYRTISTSGSEINNYSFDNTETPSTANGTYRIKCVGSETTLTALFKSLFPEETLDNYSYMYNAIAATSFVDFDFENIRLMTGITPNRDALFLNALGINSIYSSSRGTTPEQYGIDIKNSIKILNTENSSMVYIMPPRCTEVTYPPINGAYVDFYNVAKRVCDDNGILFIDLNVVRGIYGDAIFGTDGLHFSELGHNAIYEYVSNQLSKVNIKTENLQQVTTKSNQTTNGIQIIKTPSDVNFDLSKDGLALGDVGFSLIKDGGAPTNIQFDKYYISTNNSAPDRNYSSTSYNRSTDSATDPVRETITTNGYERLDKDGNKILSGDLRTSTALVGKYPGQDWATFSHKNFRGSGNEMALIQAENGLTFLNSAPGLDLIFSIGLSEKARIRNSDGSLLVGGTVSVSNATESNHAVALGQVQIEITTISDLTVALVVPNLYKYYALTGLSAIASLPPIAGNIGKTLIVTNKTASNQTIYSNDGVTPDIWSIGGGSVFAHDFKGSVTLFNDGAHWVITN